MVGYVVFITCILLLSAIFFRGKGKADACHILRGEKAGQGTLTCSIFSAWMWTTSIFGSAETYALYGVWGPITYVLGASIAFAGLILVLAWLRRRMVGTATWLGYIRRRFGKKAQLVYYLFAVIVPAYVLIEQGVGIAYVLESFYASSFKIISFFSVILVTGLIFFGGVKGLLAGERLTAAIVVAGFITGLLYVILSGDPAADLHDVMDGHVRDEAAGHPSLGASAIRYFAMAIVIAFGQILLDPAYYLKSTLAQNTRQMIFSYSMGGILMWGGITLASTLYLGKVATEAGVNLTDLFSGWGRILFSIVIIFVGLSTISHYLMGLYGTFSLELSSVILRSNDPPDRDRIVFGRILLVAVGLFCASMTIALENISLLTIDTFCAIFFAAPCVPFVIGMLSERNFGKLPIVAIVTGTIGGLIVWIGAPTGADASQFLGMSASILISILIMSLGFVKRLPYDS